MMTSRILEASMIPIIVFVASMVGWGIAWVTIGKQLCREKDPLMRFLYRTVFQATIVAAVFSALLFALPCPPVLSSFGYPHSVEEISRPEDVLRFLQEYNKAIVRTTQVLFWFIFLFVSSLLWNLLLLPKILKEKREVRELEEDK